MTYKRITTITLIALLLAGIGFFSLGLSTAGVADIAIQVIYISIVLGLLWLHFHDWPWTRQGVVLLTALAVIATTNPKYENSLSSFLIPPILAAILLNGRWVVGIYIWTYLGALIWLSVRNIPLGGLTNVYSLFITTFEALGIGLASYIAQYYTKLAEINAQNALEQQQIAEKANLQLSEHAQDLQIKNAEQERLLELVATLEIPALTLSEGVLFVPLIGHIDTRRAQKLTIRILNTVHNERAKAVIIDAGGIAVIDTGVVRHLLDLNQALKLLGCKVVFSSISAEIAQTIAQLGVDFNKMTTVRSPQEGVELIQNSTNKPALALI